MSTRARHAFAVVALPAALLVGCASAEPAAPAAIASWSEPAGIAADLVYVTDVEGFTLVTQAVGVVGDEGMSAAYWDGERGGTVLLTTMRDAGTGAVACDALPDAVSGPDELQCLVERDHATVLLAGEGVDPGTLRAAGEAVRVPSEGELEHLFSELPSEPREPVERGDLPAEGDGAPDNSVGEGG